MKLLKNAILLTAIGASSIVFGQEKSPTLITVADTKVSLEEFENIYNKNNANQSTTNQDIEEYLELFVNFKLKVQEALELKMDTDKAFVNELAGYRKQLAQPYLVDRDVNDKMIKEGYERLKEDIKVKHILVTVPQNATPADTLAAYKKVKSIQKVAQGKGANFEKIMALHNDKKEKKVIAEDLGYFTAFQMVYSFETMAYNTPVGKVSDIVKTRFGYHILKVYDRRSARGQLKVAHIMVATPKGMNEDVAVQKKAKIDEIFTKLKGGEDFGKMAKLYSDDKGTAAKSGELPWFGPGRMVDEFEEAAFGIKNDDDFCAPIKTSYGWHIIKRIEKKELGSFDEMKGEIKAKINKDGRSSRSRESLVRKIKEEYAFSENTKAKDAVYAKITDEYKKSKLKKEDFDGLNEVVFSLNDSKYSNNKQDYTQADLVDYLVGIQRRFSSNEKSDFFTEVYKNFVKKSCIDFENNLLEYKYKEFDLLMKEYRDGILLFELMEEKVWNKAVKDTAGLATFYDAHKTDYMWDSRLNASIYTCESADIAAQAKKLIKKQAKKGLSDNDIVAQLNTESQLSCNVESSKYVKGDNSIIDGIDWTTGVIDLPTEEGKVKFVNVKEVLNPMPKLLNECRGLVTADYQKYLEDLWIKELKAKYAVTVDKQVLKQVNSN